MYRSESKFTCKNELRVNISLGTLQNERFWCRPNFKTNVKIDDFLPCLTRKNEVLFLEVFNSTCLPSGNLVDGLPLDLHVENMKM